MNDSLIEYLLGELDESRRGSIAAHLETCSECTAEASELRGFLAAVETSVKTDATAPNDFTHRVMSRIPVEFRTSQKQQPQFAFNRMGALAATFGVLVVGLFLVRSLSHPPAKINSPVQLSNALLIQAHDQIASTHVSLAPPMQDSSSESAWMTQNAGYHVLPVDTSRTGTSIAGAGVMPVSGHMVAAWKLVKHGQPMTLMQMADSTTTLPALVPMPFPKYDRTLLCGNSGPCRIVAWHDRGMTFVLVATMPEDDIDNVALTTRTV